jgi:hypothetical protein
MCMVPRVVPLGASACASPCGGDENELTSADDSKGRKKKKRSVCRTHLDLKARASMTEKAHCKEA